MEQYTYDASMFKKTFENEFTYINGFLRNVHRFANRPAMTCTIRDKTWNYAELNKEVNKLANKLAEDGVGKSDVVMYQLPNSTEFVYSFLAPQKLGAINTPINFRLAPGETAYIIDDSKPKVFIYDVEFREAAEQGLAMAEHRPDRVVMVDMFAKHDAPEGYVRFADYVQNQSVDEPDVKHASHIYDETTRYYTSGTTGMPKGVPLNNMNDIFTVHDVTMHLSLTPFDKTMHMSPFFHRGGIDCVGPKPMLYIGGEIIILRQFQPKTCLSHAEKYGPTFLIGAPPMLQMISDQQQKHSYDLSSLKGIVTMGAPLSKENCIKFQETLTPNIFNGYGTTETFWNTLLRPEDLPEMAGTAGRACIDDDVAVVNVYPDKKADPSDTVAKDNTEVGEVIAKSPNKSAYTYINNEEASEQVFQNGWLYIGDLATWDENEFLTIVGRKDDMIVSAGENIHPVQVEEVLNQHPKVEESVLVGVPDDLRGEATVAYIIKTDSSLTAEELNQYCTEHSMLADYKKPRYYRFIDELPYTATGKKKHFEVRKMALNDQKQGKFEK